MTAEERVKQRRKSIVSGRSTSYDEAEMWDLKYWQSLSPQDRLNAYFAIRQDVKKIHAARIADAVSKKE